jgi:trehalose/maltose transport system substrate-binding protein
VALSVTLVGTGTNGNKKKTWQKAVKHFLATLFLLAAAGTTSVASAEQNEGDTSRQPVTLSIACSSLGLEYELCKQGARQWAEETGNKVRFISVPNSASERLALFQQLFAAHDPSIDVVQIDIVWPGILGNHFIDLSQYIPGYELEDHFPSIVENNTVNGRLVALPWYTDSGMLFYRKDLLEKYGIEVPETWEQMTEAAKVIQSGERVEGNDRFWGFVFQGRAYEGLTCNALEWLASFNAGTVVDSEGKVTVNNPNTVKALGLAQSWINTIAPRGVLNYSEEEARGVFQSGNAAFMRNWPYAWSLLNSPDSPVKGKVGIAPLPKGGVDGTHAGTLGGYELAISRYSRHKEVAVDFIRYMTSAKEQKRRALEGAFAPTRPALYEDAELLEALPYLPVLKVALDNATARPSAQVGFKYNQVSALFWSAVHSSLSGYPVAEQLVWLEQRLERVGRGGQWGKLGAFRETETPASESQP